MWSRVAMVAAVAAGCHGGDDGEVARADADPGAFDAAPGGAPDAAPPGSPDAAPFACDMNDPRPPPPDVLWAAPLSATGATTLGGHGHDDGYGPVGFCPGGRVAGEPFYRLVAAGFETDADIDAGPLGVDFWRDPDAFTGVGTSGGRVNVYLEVVDESGVPLDRGTAPDLVFARELSNGTTDDIPIDDKPDDEFQTNFPMSGGAARYGAGVQGASDRVINMRLPVNHHVTYVLVFQRS